ncbi:MAG TPA: 1-deoxy-D-xylulose-5-phosphate synthase N-terminal domain-containing protein [Bacteroidota bacterium]|nr:1-deoxy-D-xylulose-5-phosphate synthase N-terminal domain-containing protein [Bacteroidota bacterium]
MNLPPSRFANLETEALSVREHIIRMSVDGGCFIGASLSCADIIVYLYNCVLRIDPHNPQNPSRDYFFLSKGHDVPALYGTLVERGFFPRERLSSHLSVDDSIYWHPNTHVPGVEFHSGSLGHLLSVAAGVALDLLLKGEGNRVFVLLGDGELNEGSVWEAMLTIAALRIRNLVAIVDRNWFQANVETESLIPLEPLEQKWRAFRWNVITTNGHQFAELQAAFDAALGLEGPTAIIAHTVRGKGLPSIERRADRWFANFTHEERDRLLDELHGRATADLVSEPLVVR